MRTVALIAAGASNMGSAVGTRISAFHRGLRDLGWRVHMVDVATRQPSRYQDLIERRLTPKLRAVLEASGCEGDVVPSVWWQARRRIDAIRADVTVVSVPPFSLLAAASVLTRQVPLVLDYRDPWSARSRPHPLGRASRRLERIAARRATMITYAGHPELGRLLAASLDVPADRIVAVPNGLDPDDLLGAPAYRLDPTRNGTPLDLAFVGHWYGRNGPGILVEALGRVGPGVARLTTIGSVSPSIEQKIVATSSGSYASEPPKARTYLYKRLSEADAAIVTMDYASAVESRIPAKVYDYLGVGIPVIAICPTDAGLLTLPEAQRFHHVDHRDVTGLARLLREAAADRTVLNGGQPDPGRYSRSAGVKVLHEALSASVGAQDGGG